MITRDGIRWNTTNEITSHVRYISVASDAAAIAGPYAEGHALPSRPFTHNNTILIALPASPTTNSISAFSANVSSSRSVYNRLSRTLRHRSG